MNWNEVFNNIRELDEKVHKLEEVSGHDIDTLISLFAAGYEMKTSDMLSTWIEELGKMAVDDETCKPGRKYIHPTIDIRCERCNGTGITSIPGVRGFTACPVCRGYGGRKILRK